MMTNMSTTRNPYKATLGATPPLLVGRDEAIRDFSYALDDGPGTHERISLTVGPRGIGKTALLNAFESQARERGWIVISESATEGFTERLRTTIIQKFARDQKKLRGLNLTLFGIGLGANWESNTLANSTYSLRDALKDLLAYQRSLDEKLGQPPTGVFISLDEMHYQRSREVIDFGTTIQHLVREDEEIAVTMAGIPSAIKPLLASRLRGSDSFNPVTFLRRAHQIELDTISDIDVREALTAPLAETDVHWSKEALDIAVAGCQGYPFMIQLVGQCTFHEKEDGIITEKSARTGIKRAQTRLGKLVHEAALSDLSPVDRTFLIHMAKDDGPSNVGDIATRMNKTASYISNYRKRLLEAEMILDTGRGKIDFALPYLRDYLREHASRMVTSDDFYDG